MVILAPGLNTRKDSARPALLSNQSRNENSEHAASNELSSKGSDSAVPSTNLAGLSPRSFLTELTLFSATSSIPCIGSRQVRSPPRTISANEPGPQPISRILPSPGSWSATILLHRFTWPRVANRLILSYTGMVASRFLCNSAQSTEPIPSVSMLRP